MDVYCYSENVPETDPDAFSESYQDYITLHVPAFAVDSYKAAEPWQHFKSVVAIEGETHGLPKCEKPTISYANGNLSAQRNRPRCALIISTKPFMRDWPSGRWYA